MLCITGVRRGLGSKLFTKLTFDTEDVKQDVRGLMRVHFDIADDVQVDRYFKRTEFPVEPIHVIQLAGISMSGFIHKQESLDSWTTVDTNLLGSWNLLKHFQPLFKERPGSTFTLISSIVVDRPIAGTSAYAMSKGGVEALTRVAALEFARINARVNCLQLGYFNVGMIEQVPAEMQAKLLEDTPLHRFGTVDDLWAAWKFLMECEFMTGAIIPVNGGLR